MSLENAKQLIKRAVELDGKPDLAYPLYVRAIECFMVIIKYEKNQKTKEILLNRVAGYVDRAEQLREVLNQPHPTQSHPVTPVQIQPTQKGEIKWEDVAGLEGAKGLLKEAVVLPIKYPKLFQGKRKPWRGILLYGPPGTGKSLLAQAVAGEIKGTYYGVSSSDLVSKWQGESEKQVKGLFQTARDSKPSVIFIDEIDSLCRARGEGENDSERRIKNEFLVQMQGAEGVVVIGATNTPWSLDPAMRRRFDKRIYIPLPDPKSRLLILKLLGGDNEYQEIVSRTEGWSGSDLSVLVREALMEGVRECQLATNWALEEGLWTPREGGEKKSLLELNPDEIKTPPVTKDHFLSALLKTGPTVGAGELERFEEWTRLFGQNGD